MKKIYESNDLFEQLKENLYNTVKDKYHIDTVTKTRSEFYKKIVSDNRKEIDQLIEEENAV